MNKIIELWHIAAPHIAHYGVHAVLIFGAWLSWREHQAWMREIKAGKWPR